MTTPTQLIDAAFAAQERHLSSCSLRDWEARDSTRQALIDALTPTPIPKGVFLLAATALCAVYQTMTPEEHAATSNLEEIEEWAAFAVMVDPYVETLTSTAGIRTSISEALAYLTLEYSK